MLAKPDLSRRHVVRQSRSLRQSYADFLQQRVEDYKDQLPREQLLALADEAVRELEADRGEQLALTELVLLEHVDRLIIRRLNLPRFARWSERHLKLRKAQRELTHWRIDAHSPLRDIVLYLEPDDITLVVGRHCANYGHYLASYDNPVLFVADELAAVDSAERRSAAEDLSARFEAMVVDLGGDWFPDVGPALVVIEPEIMSERGSECGRRLLHRIKAMTQPGGFNCVLPPRESDSHSMFERLLEESYSDWAVRPPGRAHSILATKTH